MVQCKCLTLKGQQCKRSAVSDGFCSQHSAGKCKTRSPAKKSSPKRAAKAKKISPKRAAKAKKISPKRAIKITPLNLLMAPKKPMSPLKSSELILSQPPEYAPYEYKQGECQGWWLHEPDMMHLPMPIRSTKKWKDKAKFVDLVNGLEAQSKNFSFTRFVDAPILKKQYKGYAPSRLDPTVPVGSQEFYDTKYGICWPQGYVKHYILDNNVMPTKVFFQYVLKRAKELKLT